MIRRIYFAFAFMLLWLGMVLVGDAVGLGQIGVFEGYIILAALWVSCFTTYNACVRPKRKGRERFITGDDIQ